MGGTIAMSARGETGVSPGLDARDLLAAVPGLETVVEVEPVAFRRAPSVDLSFSDVAELADAVRRAYENDHRT